jgi:hypothetical protein
MSYRVLLRRTADGLERWTKPYDFEFSAYWWDEGNFGCDCNREWEFQRAADEEITPEPECGNSRYEFVDWKEII